MLGRPGDRGLEHPCSSVGPENCHISWQHIVKIKLCLPASFKELYWEFFLLNGNHTLDLPSYCTRTVA